MRVDFHLHTDQSDGLFPPEAVVDRARESRLRIFSITDHDTIAGCDRAQAYLAGGEPVLLPGVEFSTSYRGKEIHILGYFREGVSEGLRKFLRKTQNDRKNRVGIGLENLSRKGIKLSYEDVNHYCKGKSIGRTHMAKALLARGEARSFYEAFSKYLAGEQSLIPPSTNGVGETISVIHNEGGVAVWAHPRIELIDLHIKEFVAMGLDGVEVYTGRKQGARGLYVEMVTKDLGLLATCGSDWHGYGRHARLSGFSIQAEKIAAFLQRAGLWEESQ
jgi:predicted metal-dependent phosphoesterase TrpH